MTLLRPFWNKIFIKTKAFSTSPIYPIKYQERKQKHEATQNSTMFHRLSGAVGTMTFIFWMVLYAGSIKKYLPLKQSQAFWGDSHAKRCTTFFRCAVCFICPLPIVWRSTKMCSICFMAPFITYFRRSIKCVANKNCYIKLFSSDFVPNFEIFIVHQTEINGNFTRDPKLYNLEFCVQTSERTNARAVWAEHNKLYFLKPCKFQ